MLKTHFCAAFFLPFLYTEPAFFHTNLIIIIFSGHLLKAGDLDAGVQRTHFTEVFGSVQQEQISNVCIVVDYYSKQ